MLGSTHTQLKRFNSQRMSGDRKGNEVHHLKAALNLSLRCRANADSIGSRSIKIPKKLYNLVANISVKPPPCLNLGTFEPVKPADLSPLFPKKLIKHEGSTERYIDIVE